MNIKVGEEIAVSFDIDAREYNGKWYNTIRALRVDRLENVVSVLSPTAEPDPFKIDDLPFGNDADVEVPPFLII